MRKTLSVFCTALLILTHTALPVLAGQTSVSVSGVVADAAGKPVTTAKVIVKDGSGKLDEAATNSQGRYRLNGLAPGQYRLTLASSAASFREETVVANVGHQGLTVNWMIAAAAAPIAAAQPGVAAADASVSLSDVLTVLGVNVVGGGFGAGMAAAAGGFSGNKRNGSPSL